MQTCLGGILIWIVCVMCPFSLIHPTVSHRADETVSEMQNQRQCCPHFKEM